MEKVLSFLKKPSVLLIGFVIIVGFRVLALNQTLIPVNVSFFKAEFGIGRTFSTHGADDTGAMGGDFPFGQFVKNSFQEGEFPHWNPYQGLGEPFANAATSVLYPPNWLRMVLPGEWFDLINLLNWFLFGLFTYLLCRELGLAKRFAVLSSITVMGLIHTQIYLETNSISATVAFFPLFLLGIERASIKSRRYAWFVVAIATYGIFNGFHPGPALGSFLIGFLYFLHHIIFLKEVRVRVFWQVAFGFLIGTALSAFHLYPFVDHLFNDVGDMKFQPMRDYFTTRSLIQTVVPYFWGPLNEILVGGFSYIKHGSQYIAMPILPVILVFGFISRRLVDFRNTIKNKRLLLILVLFLFMIGWIFGVYPFTIFHDIPGLSRMKMLYLLGMSNTLFAVLFGFAVEALTKNKKRSYKVILWVGSAFLLVTTFVYAQNVLGDLMHSSAWIQKHVKFSALFVVASVFTFLVVHHFLSKKALLAFLFSQITLQSSVYFLGNLKSPGKDLAIATVILVLLTLILFGIEKYFKNRNKRWGFVLITILAVICFQIATKNNAPLSARKDPFKQPQYVSFLKDVQQGGVYRHYGTHGYLVPNSSMSIPLSAINILAPVMDKTSVDFMMRLDHTQVPSFYGGIPGFPHLPQESPINYYYQNKKFWDYVAVRYLVTSQDYVSDIKQIPLAPYYISDFTNDSYEIKKHEMVDEDPSKSIGSVYTCNSSLKNNGFKVKFLKVSPRPLPDVKFEIENLSSNRKWRMLLEGSEIISGYWAYLQSPGGFCRKIGDRIKVHIANKEELSGFLSIPFNKEGGLSVTPYAIDVTNDTEFLKIKYPLIVPIEKAISFITNCPHKDTRTIAVFTSTIGKVYQNQKADVTFNNLDSSKIFRVKTTNRVIRDNSYLFTSLPNGVCQRRGDLLKVTYEFNFSHSVPIVFWGNAKGDLRYFWLKDREESLQLVYENEKEDSYIWESQTAGKRLYLSSNIETVASQSEAYEKFIAQNNLKKTVFATKNDILEKCEFNPGEDTLRDKLEILNFSLTPNTVKSKIKTSNGGIVTVVDSHRLGWRAKVNGKDAPVFEVNGMFRGICIGQPGEYDIEMTYRPRTQNVANASVIVALLLMGFGVGLPWYTRRNNG